MLKNKEISRFFTICHPEFISGSFKDSETSSEWIKNKEFSRIFIIKSINSANITLT